MSWQDRIVIDPGVLSGKPIVKGTRLAVEFIVELLAQGWTEAEILKNYPGITREDILACLAYARETRSRPKGMFPIPLGECEFLPMRTSRARLSRLSARGGTTWLG